MFTKVKVGIIQRAFELASQGSCATITEIKNALIKEGYENAPSHLAGPTIIRQLKTALKNAPTPQPA